MEVGQENQAIAAGVRGGTQERGLRGVLGREGGEVGKRGACPYRRSSESQGDDPALPFLRSQVPWGSLHLCALPHQGQSSAPVSFPEQGKGSVSGADTNSFSLGEDRKAIWGRERPWAGEETTGNVTARRNERKKRLRGRIPDQKEEEKAPACPHPPTHHPHKC